MFMSVPGIQTTQEFQGEEVPSVVSALAVKDGPECAC
jgi:hypothetical protein